MRQANGKNPGEVKKDHTNTAKDHTNPTLNTEANDDAFFLFLSFFLKLVLSLLIDTRTQPGQYHSWLKLPSTKFLQKINYTVFRQSFPRFTKHRKHMKGMTCWKGTLKGTRGYYNTVLIWSAFKRAVAICFTSTWPPDRSPSRLSSISFCNLDGKSCSTISCFGRGWCS